MASTRDSRERKCQVLTSESTMEYIFVHDSENCGLTDTKMKGDKRERGSSMVKGQRKRLADISNLPRESNPLNQVANLKSSSLGTNQYVEQLHKENIALMKVVADRNKIIELSGIGLQKLRINVQNLQQQNLQLAQANSQMLVEINSGKDKRKVLDHELGCKNGLLHAIKLELKEKTNLIMFQIAGKEFKAELVKHDEAVKFTLANSRVNKPFTTNRRRQSKKPSLEPTTSKPFKTKEKIDNERHSLRRSKRFISEEPIPPVALSEEPDSTEVFSEELVLDLSPIAVKTFKVEENKRLCLRRQSARLKSDDPETTEHLPEMEDAKPMETEENADYKSPSPRRQSMMFKSEESVAIEAMSDSEDPEPSLAANHTTNVKPLKAKQNKSHCTKRQSVRVKSEEPVPTKDSLIEIDYANIPVAPLCDNLMPESVPTSVKKEDQERHSVNRDIAQELARLSVGRPLRRAAEKVQSYKEIPINMKMRRSG